MKLPVLKFKKTDKNAPLPPNHPVVVLRRLLAEPLGRLPTGLVVILAASLTLMVLAGVALQLAARSTPHDPFLAQRLATDPAHPTLDAARLQGLWIHSTETHAMTLELRDGAFEWLVKAANDENIRFYARGSYKIAGDVLILSQRTDMGQPRTPRGMGFTFLSIAFTTLNVRAEENGKLLVWVVPRSERARLDGSVEQLFPAEKDKGMTWIKRS